MYEILKLIGGGLLALVCAYIGLLVKRRYRDKANFYGKVCDFINYARRELSIKMTSIPETCLGYAGENKDEFSAVLRDFASGVRTGKRKASRASLLKENEINEIDDFLDGLGKSSLTEQIVYLDSWEKKFADERGRKEDESKRLGGMYFKLLVLLGVALMIVTA